MHEKVWTGTFHPHLSTNLLPTPTKAFLWTSPWAAPPLHLHFTPGSTLHCCSLSSHVIFTSDNGISGKEGILQMLLCSNGSDHLVNNKETPQALQVVSVRVSSHPKHSELCPTCPIFRAQNSNQCWDLAKSGKVAKVLNSVWKEGGPTLQSQEFPGSFFP